MVKHQTCHSPNGKDVFFNNNSSYIMNTQIHLQQQIAHPNHFLITRIISLKPTPSERVSNISPFISASYSRGLFPRPCEKREQHHNLSNTAAAGEPESTLNMDCRT